MDERFSESNANRLQGRREQRRQPRFQTVHVQEPTAGQEAPTPGALSAKLIDISDGGIGVEMSCPVEVGSVLSIAGELHSTRYCVGLRGSVRVAHCRQQPDGAFRTGLAFQGVTCRNISCSHELAISLKLPGNRASQYFVLDSNGEKTCVPVQVWGNLRVIVPPEDRKRLPVPLTDPSTAGADGTDQPCNEALSIGAGLLA